MKISRRFYPFIFSGIMAVFMSLFMSLVMVWINVGLGPIFFIAWIKSFAAGFVVAFPTALFVAPLVKTLTDKLMKV